MKASKSTRTRGHEDNEEAIKVVKKCVTSRRTRQVDVKHHIVRDAIEGRIVYVEHVCSEEQHADILTKTIDVKAFKKHARFPLNFP